MKICKKILKIAMLFIACQIISNVSLAAVLELQKKAPDFSLKDPAGEKHSLAQYKGKYVVLEWFNPECPFVKKHYNSGHMQDLQKKMTQDGVVWLSINSSAPGKQGHLEATEAGEWKAKVKAASSAVLLDDNGNVGKTYDAKTTPHMYIIDPKGKLIYQGAIDNQPTTDPNDLDKATNYVELAIKESRGGKPLSQPETKAYGCAVKY